VLGLWHRELAALIVDPLERPSFSLPRIRSASRMARCATAEMPHVGAWRFICGSVNMFYPIRGEQRPM
jgi:hypothetical protein